MSQKIDGQGDIVNQLPKKMYLTTHRKARKHLTRLINEFNQDPGADVTRYRCITFMFKTLLDYFQFGKNLEVEERIEKIEERLEELGR